MLWIENYRNDLVTRKVIKSGVYNPSKIIDGFSKNLFNSKSCVVYNDKFNNKYNFEAMEEITKKLLKEETNSLYKPTFSFEGVYLTLDIIKRVKRGYNVYLVKPTKNIKQVYLIELAYISYMLKKIGLPIYRYCLITVNTDYVRNGSVEPKKYFKINYVGKKIKNFEQCVEQNLLDCQNMMNGDKEPKTNFISQCVSSNGFCPYAEHCLGKIPNPSVFDLYACNKKSDLFKSGIVTFEDILKSDYKLSEIQKRQIDFNLDNLPIYVDKERLREFLNKISYPVYFLDFETTQYEFPLYDGIRPFEQIPFQYSLHYILEKGGEIYHKEFLAKEDSDPRYDLASSIVKNIPTDCKIIAYNISAEKGIISSLSDRFPDLKEHLKKLTENFIDLLEPFENGMVYEKNMGGSFSLKSVLPALFPDNPELNYSNLGEVHNGKDARVMFPTLLYLSEEERKIERDNLLKYCYLDTYALVKILEKLEELSE